MTPGSDHTGESRATPSLYFAYGSNLSLAQMASRCPAATAVGRALAKGYTLVFPRPSDTWMGGVAGITEKEGEGYHVEGAAYELTPACVAALDEYEGLLEEQAHYWRATIEIVLVETGQKREAMTYFAHPVDSGGGSGHHEPHASYVNVMLDGARDHGLSADWVRMLKAMLEGAPRDPADVQRGRHYDI